MPRSYNDPANGTGSDIGGQFETFHWIRKALIEKRKEIRFGQLSNNVRLPKHMGKTIKRYHYLPLLDDRNVNDQGIDASGATIANGNLYGSSKDVGTIQGKLPALGEHGGRVNRVGFTRIEIEGSITRMGFFDEYTQESLDFDTDAQLQEHVHREMISGAIELEEDATQIDLLNSAGVIRYGGVATQDSEVDETCEPTWGDLLRLSIDLDNNNTPKTTRMITGTRLTDTKTVYGGRPMFIGSELQPTFDAMVDSHGERAFIPAHKYAAGSTLMNGEIGSVGHFRLIVAEEMMHWEGVGAVSDGSEGFRTDGSKFNLYPMLVVGSEAFATIGFQTDGKQVMFKITHKKPGKETADRTDPYGETGFMSIKWYHGYICERPERIALFKTPARH